MLPLSLTINPVVNPVVFVRRFPNCELAFFITAKLITDRVSSSALRASHLYRQIILLYVLQSFPNLFAFSNLSKRLIFSAFLNLLGVSTFLSFPDNVCEIPAKFHQNFAEKSQIFIEKREKNENFPAKIWTVFR